MNRLMKSVSFKLASIVKWEATKSKNFKKYRFEKFRPKSLLGLSDSEKVKWERYC